VLSEAAATVAEADEDDDEDSTEATVEKTVGAEKETVGADEAAELDGKDGSQADGMDGAIQVA
jgi:hypothetical protein